MALLLILLERQTALTSLEMRKNNLSDTQKQQIRDVVQQTVTSCDIKFEKKPENPCKQQ